jgi:hypothetical protein
VDRPGSVTTYARRQGRRARDRLNRLASRTAGAAGLGHYLVLDYPASARNAPTVRRDGPLHDVVAAAEPAYREALGTIASYEDDLGRIAVSAGADASAPAWRNGFLPGLDSAAIYSFVRSRRPVTYLEVGSGSSTRFARRAIADGKLETRIVSIDPSPRAEVDALCDVVVRGPLELADPAAFAQLGAGDVVFLDGSHRVFTGSDATVFLLDLLPTLAPGVLVGVHDVYLPDDYPRDVADRHYSEQYLLAALLLGRPAWLRLVLAAHYVSDRPSRFAELQSLWRRRELQGVETHGVAFWLERV